jgi:hypothetical protein
MGDLLSLVLRMDESLVRAQWLTAGRVVTTSYFLGLAEQSRAGCVAVVQEVQRIRYLAKWVLSSAEPPPSAACFFLLLVQ